MGRIAIIGILWLFCGVLVPDFTQTQYGSQIAIIFLIVGFIKMHRFDSVNYRIYKSEIKQTLSALPAYNSIIEEAVACLQNGTEVAVIGDRESASMNFQVTRSKVNHSIYGNDKYERMDIRIKGPKIKYYGKAIQEDIWAKLPAAQQSRYHMSMYSYRGGDDGPDTTSWSGTVNLSSGHVSLNETTNTSTSKCICFLIGSQNAKESIKRME